MYRPFCAIIPSTLPAVLALTLLSAAVAAPAPATRWPHGDGAPTSNPPGIALAGADQNDEHTDGARWTTSVPG